MLNKLLALILMLLQTHTFFCMDIACFYQARYLPINEQLKVSLRFHGQSDTLFSHDKIISDQPSFSLEECEDRLIIKMDETIIAHITTYDWDTVISQIHPNYHENYTMNFHLFNNNNTLLCLTLDQTLNDDISNTQKTPLVFGYVETAQSDTTLQKQAITPTYKKAIGLSLVCIGAASFYCLQKLFFLFYTE